MQDAVLSDFKLSTLVKNILPRFGQKAAVAAVVLFLLFDFVALSLNIWLSYRIEVQAVNINLAGRQRMLSQRLVKDLLILENQTLQQLELARVESLTQTFILFDNTLNGFYRGGVTQSSDNKSIYLEALTSSRTRYILEETLPLWEPIEAHLRAFLSRPENSQSLQQATMLAKANSDIILTLMNELTSVLENETQLEASKIRFFQGLAFFLALLNFSIVVSVYWWRIRNVKQELDIVDSVINRISTGVVVVDSKRQIKLCNDAMAYQSGYRNAELLGAPLNKILVVRDGESFGKCKNGELYHCFVEISDVKLGRRPAKVYTISDDSHHHLQRQQLSMLAYHDSLTGLPNRLLFDDRLNMAISQAQRQRDRLVILFIDLDKFKEVNDTYGHDFGDNLLKVVAERLRDMTRMSDTVSRRGGDEFTIILANVTDNASYQQIVTTLHQKLTAPYEVNDQVISIGASIGVACYPDDASSADDLLLLADKAMYVAKHKDVGKIVLASSIQ